MLRLPEFQLLSPQSLSEALALLQADPEHSSILAGGTDLLPNMKRRQQTPRRLISLRNVAELGQLTVAADEVRIGGSVRLRTIETHEALAAELRGLVQAVSQIATVHIRCFFYFCFHARKKTFSLSRNQAKNSKLLCLSRQMSS